MPDASEHRAISLIVGLALLLVGWHFVEIQTAVIVAIATIVGEYALSPDLDLNCGSRSYRAWGPISGFWRPYAKLVRHRSALSHWPIIGTGVRLAYIGTPALLALYLCGVDLASLFSVHSHKILAAWCGLEISASIHWLLDHTA